jgi:hypothetical protein
MVKWINNDLQNTTQKTNDWARLFLLKTGGEHRCSELMQPSSNYKKTLQRQRARRWLHRSKEPDYLIGFKRRLNIITYTLLLAAYLNYFI